MARLGGDEFAVLLRDVGTFADPTAVAERILEVLADPFDIDGHRLNARASIGIAIGSSAVSSDELLRQADIAMYAAKSEGKGRYAVFDPDLAREFGPPTVLEPGVGTGARARGVVPGVPASGRSFDRHVQVIATRGLRSSRTT